MIVIWDEFKYNVQWPIMGILIWDGNNMSHWFDTNCKFMTDMQQIVDIPSYADQSEVSEDRE